MHLFKSAEPNLVHYVTAVTYGRVQVFSNAHCCELFIDALAETRLKDPFKLIGYVVMPDHFHLLANPLGMDVRALAGRLKGRVASRILKWLRAQNYIHMNPVGAGLCDHPAKWRWSSYHAYFPDEEGAVPIEIDWRWLWSAEEIAAAAGKSAG